MSSEYILRFLPDYFKTIQQIIQFIIRFRRGRRWFLAMIMLSTFVSYGDENKI